jgi:hypothetical protein
MCAGVPVEGICLYPVLSHPGWSNGRMCPNGLFEMEPRHGRRPVHAPMAAELRRQQAAFEALIQIGMLIEANASGAQFEIGADTKGPKQLIGSALICWTVGARRGLDAVVPIRECVAQLLRTRSDASTCNSMRSAEIRCIVAVRSPCASNEP